VARPIRASVRFRPIADISLIGHDHAISWIGNPKCYTPPMMKGILALAILAAPSAACSDQTNNPDFVRYVATDVKKDCLKGLDKAPNQAMRQHLQRLCDCTEQRILATPMGGSDNDRSVN